MSKFEDRPEAIDRRSFLRKGGQIVGGAALLGVGGPALLRERTSRITTTATTDAVFATANGGSLGVLNFQLPWLYNDVEQGGEYIADFRGYYRDQGFSSVNLMAGGPTATPVETVVQTGKALVGLSGPSTTAAALEKGFTLKTIGAVYQVSPLCIMSLASKPISTPQDMIGKTIGVATSNNATWAAFLKVNHIQPSQVHTIAVEFDPAPLVTGECQGFFAFISSEPITLANEGVKTHNLLLSDYGLPSVGLNYVVTDDSLKNKRAELPGANDSRDHGLEGVHRQPKVAG